jgi:hypothetical protein
MGNDYIVRSFSEPSVSRLLDISRLGRLWSTTGNLSENTKNLAKVSKKRGVRFQSQVKVILIPCRTEYVDANLVIALWWSDSDYISFKSSAVKELKALMLKKSIKSKEAIHMLYQTGIDCEEILKESSKTLSEEDMFLSSTTECNIGIIDESLDPQPLGLLDAETDRNLTDLKRCDDPPPLEILPPLHPLAYMCQ